MKFGELHFKTTQTCSQPSPPKPPVALFQSATSHSCVETTLQNRVSPPLSSNGKGKRLTLTDHWTGQAIQGKGGSIHSKTVATSPLFEFTWFSLHNDATGDTPLHFRSARLPRLRAAVNERAPRLCARSLGGVSASRRFQNCHFNLAAPVRLPAQCSGLSHT